MPSPSRADERAGRGYKPRPFPREFPIEARKGNCGALAQLSFFDATRVMGRKSAWNRQRTSSSVNESRAAYTKSVGAVRGAHVENTMYASKMTGAVPLSSGAGDTGGGGGPAPTATASKLLARYNNTATLLADGTVLVVEGGSAGRVLSNKEQSNR